MRSRARGSGATFVVIDPNSSSTLYAGGPGGLSSPSAFQSSDGGATWSDISFGLNSGTIIHPTYDSFDSLVIDPATSTLLAGLVQGSSFAAIGKKPKTATGWQKNSISILGSRIRSIAVDPSNSQTIYATVSSLFLYDKRGVLKSVDGGATWNYINSGLPTQPEATAIAIDPASPSTLYAGLLPGIYKSVDSGASWTASYEGFPGGATINTIVVDPLTPSTVYAGTALGIYKSVDAGAHWAASNAGLGAGISASPPVLTSLSPTSAPQDSILDLTFSGTGFSSPFGMDLGPGLTLISAKLNSSTSITATIQTAHGSGAGISQRPRHHRSWNKQCSFFRCDLRHHNAANDHQRVTGDGAAGNHNDSDSHRHELHAVAGGNCLRQRGDSQFDYCFERDDCNCCHFDRCNRDDWPTQPATVDCVWWAQ